MNLLSFYEIINGDDCLCYSCQKKLNPKFIKFEVEGIEGIAIYEYDDNIKSILYQFKGCYDVELAPVFLNRFKRELHYLYKGYMLIPAPSYILEDKKRGFRHIEKMFECLNLPIEYLIEKVSPFKQAMNTRKGRMKIAKHLALNHKEKIEGKKILIVDDVSTTGSTLKSMIRLIRDAKPKQIKVLVMSKRVIK